MYVECKSTEENLRRTISNIVTYSHNFNKKYGTDLITFYAENTGGSGTFHYAIGKINKRYTRPVFLGDRIVIENIELNEEKDGLILEYIGHGEDDPFCCPSTKMSAVVRVIDNDIILEKF